VPDGLVVLTTHGGAAKYGVASLLGWPDEVVSGVHGLDNCHWTELRRYPGKKPEDQPAWRLHAHNAGV
jgi:probable phosphoglycerate mutase